MYKGTRLEFLVRIVSYLCKSAPYISLDTLDIPHLIWCVNQDRSSLLPSTSCSARSVNKDLWSAWKFIMYNLTTKKSRLLINHRREDKEQYSGNDNTWSAKPLIRKDPMHKILDQRSELNFKYRKTMHQKSNSSWFFYRLSWGSPEDPNQHEASRKCLRLSNLCFTIPRCMPYLWGNSTRCPFWHFYAFHVRHKFFLKKMIA